MLVALYSPWDLTGAKRPHFHLTGALSPDAPVWIRAWVLAGFIDCLLERKFDMVLTEL